MHALIAAQLFATTVIHTFDWMTPVLAVKSLGSSVHLFDWLLPVL